MVGAQGIHVGSVHSRTGLSMAVKGPKLLVVDHQLCTPPLSGILDSCQMASTIHSTWPHLARIYTENEERRLASSPLGARG